ncbi:hypothetical protein PFX98_14555 [Paucibacter sediminis]|uniref:Uncharacterized protein n=1 Tax=Paucibacter sediminis TaxID=3019553 RepID=A0AA95N7U9_9BURK|nr:hypothetical protein [Paucibacter sp. S2-9]WIT10155.1 hypothetical protein PFX98_14555 [Paucibacter sp. S2-9]
MRHTLVMLTMLMGLAGSATAQFTVSIGINVPSYPELRRVPGYPVYYAPGLRVNFFFYDGLYWVLEGDDWYASPWYNGPWRLTRPELVPLYVLRIPVRYYRSPPSYFQGWQLGAPPRWGDHWGPAWQQQRPGWERWDRRSAPAPAPLPSYQRQYPAARYPQPEQQQALQQQQYRYRPRDATVRELMPPPPAPHAPTVKPNPPPRSEALRQAPPPAPMREKPQAHERPPEREQQPQAHEPPARGKPPAAEKRKEHGDERGNERGNERDQDRKK